MLLIVIIASKGKGAYMLKNSSKKKRSKEEMEEVKHEEDLLNKDKQEFLREYKQLKSSDSMSGSSSEKMKRNQELLNKLYS